MFPVSVLHNFNSKIFSRIREIESLSTNLNLNLTVCDFSLVLKLTDSVFGKFKEILFAFKQSI